MKRILAILLSVMMLVVMLAACGGGADDGSPAQGSTTGQTGEDTGENVSAGDGEEGGPPVYVPPNYELPEKEADVIRYTADGRRHIIVGVFYAMYFDSTHDSIEADPNYTLNPETAQMRLDNIRRIEEKYNVYLEFVDLTWDGIIESIPVSIMTGIPDCDVYLCDPQFGVPAVLNNMATALEDMEGIEPAYKEDVLASGGNIVMTSMKVPGQDKTYLFRQAEIEPGMYMIGYNRNMLQAKGLEDPQELWYRGEWTWDVFLDYCRQLTDSANDIYGYGGFWKDTLQLMLFSNDTAFAGGPTQTIDDPKTIQVLEVFDQLYNIDKTARPWVTADWDINNQIFYQGKTAFFVSASWINEQFINYLDGAPMPFEIGMVPSPVGPAMQGRQDEMATYNATTGNSYFIPRYIKDPGEVFNVMYEFTNWFDYDLEYRDDTDWLFENLLSDENIDIYMENVGRYGFDLLMDIGAPSEFDRMLERDTGPAEFTPAQYAATYSQVFQDALDNYFR